MSPAPGLCGVGWGCPWGWVESSDGGRVVPEHLLGRAAVGRSVPAPERVEGECDWDYAAGSGNQRCLDRAGTPSLLGRRGQVSFFAALVAAWRFR